MKYIILIMMCILLSTTVLAYDWAMYSDVSATDIVFSVNQSTKNTNVYYGLCLDNSCIDDWVDVNTSSTAFTNNSDISVNYFNVSEINLSGSLITTWDDVNISDYLTSEENSTFVFKSGDNMTGNLNTTGNITANDVIIPSMKGNDAYESLNDAWNLFNSAGQIIGGNITDNGDGTVAVSAGNCILRDADDDISQLRFYSWDANNSISVSTDDTIYIGIDLNGGDAKIVTSLDTFTWDYDTSFPLGGVMNIKDNIFPINSPWQTGDALTNLIEESQGVGPRIDNRVKGLIFGETGTRQLTLSSSNIMYMGQEYPVDAKDTSDGDDFYAFYMDGGTSYNVETGKTQWNNTHYDDGSGTLQEMNNNYYANIWLWVWMDEVNNGYIMVLYPQNQYSNLANAQAEEIPNFPTEWYSGGILRSRLTFKKGENSATSLTTIQNSNTLYSIVTDHTTISNLGWSVSGHTGTANTFAGFDATSAATYYTEASYLWSNGSRYVTGNLSAQGFNSSYLCLDSSCITSWNDVNITDFPLDFHMGNDSVYINFSTLDVTGLGSIPMIIGNSNVFGLPITGWGGSITMIDYKNIDSVTLALSSSSPGGDTIDLEYVPSIDTLLIGGNIHFYDIDDDIYYNITYVNSINSSEYCIDKDCITGWSDVNVSARNPFNQSLNTSDIVQFAGLNISGNVTILGNISVNPDNDGSFDLGRWSLGYISGFPDIAYLAHHDYFDWDTFAISQGADGITYINTKDGGYIYFAEGMNTKMRLGEPGLTLYNTDLLFGQWGSERVEINHTDETLTISSDYGDATINVLGVVNSTQFCIENDCIDKWSDVNSSSGEFTNNSDISVNYFNVSQINLSGSVITSWLDINQTWYYPNATVDTLITGNVTSTLSTAYANDTYEHATLRAEIDSNASQFYPNATVDALITGNNSALNNSDYVNFTQISTNIINSTDNELIIQSTGNITIILGAS